MPSWRVIFTKASWGESRAPGTGVTGRRRTNNPPENTLTPLWDGETPAHGLSSYQCASEVGGGLVPGGAAVAVLADVQVVHEPVAVEETLP